MYFQEFCMRIANPDHITTPLSPIEEPSYEIQRLTHVLIVQLVNRMGILDHTHVWHVENAFNELESMDRIEEILKERYNGEIPNWVIESLAMNLYRVRFHELNETQQAIIKTLAVYICISAKGK